MEYTDSEDRNPVYEFTIPGNYTVNLTASNENGTDSTSATINVTEEPVVFLLQISLQIQQKVMLLYLSSLTICQKMQIR